MNNSLYERNRYLETIEANYKTKKIKILSGIRRVGKSVMLRQLAARLRKSGVHEKSIIFIDTDKPEFRGLKSPGDLPAAVTKQLSEKGIHKYLFLDGIERVEVWQEYLRSLTQKGNIDVIIALPGIYSLFDNLHENHDFDYTEIPVYPLNFNEFMQFRNSNRLSKEKEFQNYIKLGGLPGVHQINGTETTIYQYLNSIFYTILLKDIVANHNIRNVELLESIGRYLFVKIGFSYTEKNIADYLKTVGFKIGFETVQKYLNYFTQANIISKCSRFDIVKKRALLIGEKYYLVEFSMRHSILGWNENSAGSIMENIVYNRLLQRSYQVYAGKYYNYEIDFYATKEKEHLYIQVGNLFESGNALNKKLRPLKAINDNYPKVLLSLDKKLDEDYSGIRHINLIDFCLNDRNL